MSERTTQSLWCCLVAMLVVAGALTWAGTLTVEFPTQMVCYPTRCFVPQPAAFSLWLVTTGASYGFVIVLAAILFICRSSHVNADQGQEREPA